MNLLRVRKYLAAPVTAALCALSLSATVGTVVQAEIGDGPTPTLTTTSCMVEGSKRSWKSTEEFIQEVSAARIYDGVHYRNSTEVGMAMGHKLGARAVEKHFGTQ